MRATALLIVCVMACLTVAVSAVAQEGHRISAESASSGYEFTTARRESGCEQCDRAFVAATRIGSEWRASVSTVPHADVQLLAKRVADPGAVLHGDVGPAGAVHQGADAAVDRSGKDHGAADDDVGNAVSEVSHHGRPGARCESDCAKLPAVRRTSKTGVDFPLAARSVADKSGHGDAYRSVPQRRRALGN